MNVSLQLVTRSVKEYSRDIDNISLRWTVSRR